MTELDLTTAIPTTPLATLLTDRLTDSQVVSSPAPTLVPYLGAMTPQHLDAPAAETNAIFRGAAIHDLGWLRQISLRGEDRFRWLSGMVTNAVETLSDNTGAYNLILNAQGRIQGDAYVWRNGDELELEITAAQSEALLAHLDRFIIMDDVELLPLPGQSALGITGPQADAILTSVGLSPLPEPLSSAPGSVANIPIRLCRSYGTVVPQYALWTSVEHIPALWHNLQNAGASPVGSAALETLRIVEGIPAYEVDIQSRDLAQETAQTRALNFTKGCYLGQEIVERIRSRGQVHRHLRAIELTPDPGAEPPAVGAELRIAGAPDSKPAATLTSVAVLQLDGVQRIFSIGMVRAEAEVGSLKLTYPGGTATILNAPPKLTF
jgi:folate-binding protein YgfZ